MLRSLFLFLSALTLLNGEVCNTCETPVSVPVSNGVLTYKMCLFETAFTLQTNSPVDWLFLGTACDDCDDKTIASEGVLCNKMLGGYHGVANGVVGKSFQKVEYNELECEASLLKIDRYMPNLWLKNMTIDYFVASGLGEPSIQQSDVVSIQYA